MRDVVPPVARDVVPPVVPDEPRPVPAPAPASGAVPAQPALAPIAPAVLPGPGPIAAEPAQRGGVRSGSSVATGPRPLTVTPAAATVQPRLDPFSDLAPVASSAPAGAASSGPDRDGAVPAPGGLAGAPGAPSSPTGAGAGAAGGAAASGPSLFVVLCLCGALAAWLLTRLVPAPATCRPAAFSWLLERPG